MAGLFGYLIRANATLTVSQQRASRDTSGGTQFALATVADDVPALLSQLSGDRDGRYGGDVDVVRLNCVSDSSAVGRQDAAFTVKTCPSMPWLVGVTFRVDSVTGHPQSQGGWIPAVYRAQCSSFNPAG